MPFGGGHTLASKSGRFFQNCHNPGSWQRYRITISVSMLFLVSSLCNHTMLISFVTIPYLLHTETLENTIREIAFARNNKQVTKDLGK